MGVWLRYSLIRFGIFAGVFGLMWLFGIEWWVAALFAVGISFFASYIFFFDQRQQMARDLGEAIQRRKKRPVDADAEAEDRQTESS